jgi:MFS transporter, ACS family, hexuronate transporter
VAQAALSNEDVSAPRVQATPWAWGICWLMFASTTLCYMDRQAMSLVGTKIQGEFHIDDTGLGWVLAAFSLSYAFFQVPAGYLADRWDVRWTYASAVAWWSLAGIMAAFAPTIGLLMALRGLLGLGESFNWPCALRATAIVLPPADRGLGNGIFNSGAAIGAVLTPLIVTPIAAYYGWRTAFVTVGILGFLWVILWLVMLGPDQSGRFTGRLGAKSTEQNEFTDVSQPTELSTTALLALVGLLTTSVAFGVSAIWVGRPAIWWAIALIMVGLLVVARLLPLASLRGSDWLESLGHMVRLQRFWIMAVVSISINVCWHFLVNWMPSYIQKDLKLTYVTSGLLSAIPFLAADAGNIGGGALSRHLARTGMLLDTARARVIGLSALLILSAVGVGLTRNPLIVMPLLVITALGVAAYMANYFALCQEVSARHTGLVVGYLGGLGNLFAAGFVVFAGWISDTTKGFGPSFVIVGLLPLLGVAAIALGWGSGETVLEPKSS